MTTCYDVIIPIFREMVQIREQHNYLSDRHQNWYLTSQQVVKFWKYRKDEFIFGFPTFKMLQIPILVSVRQVVPLFPNLVHFPKIGDNNNNDVTAGAKIFKIFKNWLHIWIPRWKKYKNAKLQPHISITSNYIDSSVCQLYRDLYRGNVFLAPVTSSTSVGESDTKLGQATVAERKELLRCVFFVRSHFLSSFCYLIIENDVSSPLMAIK